MRDQALNYVQTHQADTLEALKAFLRIPSVGALPEHNDDTIQAAQWLVDRLTAIGLHHVQIMPTPGHPMVYADWLEAGPDAPTLMIYGHYDVQPVDPLEEWLTPPFEPTVKGEDIYGRGTADDKGQLYIHVAAVEAYLQAAGRLPLNIKFLLEGEEESGSTHLEDFVKAHQSLLQADAALISDSHILDPATPILITGVRGLTYMEISMRGSRQDLHSGTYGGVVENPLNAMVKLLASLRDEQGRVTIPGFYDDVKPLNQAERRAINTGPTSETSVLAETGAPALWGDPDYTVAERTGARPTLDIHGIKGGFIGHGAKTVIPATASAKVSMRLVAHQDHKKIAELFRQHVLSISPPTMEVTVDTINTGGGAVIDMATPAMQAAADAYEQTFGRPPLYLREGGSLPIVPLFIDILHAPVVLMGFGLPDDNLHAPNEKFHLPNFYRGIETAIVYYDILAERLAKRQAG
ncbi:MAG: dipeptidase [Anaerolineales bacterium]|nr:dipeptidase [Anaerolineales bacterium]